MPYSIRKRGGKFCVVKITTGQTVPSGCYSQMAKARARMTAMNINVHKVPGVYKKKK